MRRIAYMMGVIVASFGMLTAFNIWYTNHVQEQSEQRYRQLIVDSDRQWCSLLTGLDKINAHAAPTTASGKQIAAGIHALTITFDC